MQHKRYHLNESVSFTVPFDDGSLDLEFRDVLEEFDACEDVDCGRVDHVFVGPVIG